MAKGRVVVGLSGGVDSSVAAWLLKNQGYEVIGVTMQTWEDTGEDVREQSVIRDARKIAKALGIPHHILDFHGEFTECVVRYFAEEYLRGRTPNPCVVCNRKVKWEAMLTAADRLGAEYLATGHYARILRLPNGRFTVGRAVNDRKDQTYALYGLTQKQLSRTLMPVGMYEKEQIRQFAEEAQIPVARKPDSQEICFIPDGDYASFIERFSGRKGIPGNFVDREGTVLGQHKGIIHYTIGQRKGLGLAMGRPVFVQKICPETNEVVLGENEDLFVRKVLADHLNFMSVEQLSYEDRMEVTAKIRYNHKGERAVIRRIGDDRLECEFLEPVRAVTPGQALVLYQNDHILGGGIII